MPLLMSIVTLSIVLSFTVFCFVSNVEGRGTFIRSHKMTLGELEKLAKKEKDTEQKLSATQRRRNKLTHSYYHDDHHDDHHDDGWKKRYDSQHRQYWENSITGQTQWENPYHHRLHSTNTHIQKLCDLHTIHIKSLRSTHVATEICTDHESVAKSDENCIDLIVSEMSKISLIQSSVDDFEKRLVKLHDAEKAVEYAITKLLKATDITEMNN